MSRERIIETMKLVGAWALLLLAPVLLCLFSALVFVLVGVPS